jgi:hypothetical protein
VTQALTVLPAPDVRVVLVRQPAPLVVNMAPPPAAVVFGLGGGSAGGGAAITGYGLEATQLLVLQRLIDGLGVTLAPAQLDALASEATLALANDHLASLDSDSLQLVVNTAAILSAISAQQPLTNAQLRASPPAVRDDYSGDALTTDQTGAGAVLEFAVPPLHLVAVDVDPADLQDTTSYLCRATVDGSAPSATRGWRCRSGQTTYLPVPCAGGMVKVFAPAGVTVSVQGGVRA